MRDVMHDFALPTFRDYAARWGYQIRATNLAADGIGADPAARRAKWQKIRLLRKALTHYQLVVWLDADILLTRNDEDIASHLHPRHFQALALEQVPAEHRINPNTGVWVLRSHPDTFEFLDAVEAAGPQPGPWADQGAVLAALGWDCGDDNYHWARPGRGSKFLAGTSDSYTDRPLVTNPHALHFMGMTPAARRRHMAEYNAPVHPGFAAVR